MTHLDIKEAKRFLGLNGTSFWRTVWLANSLGLLKPIKYGGRLYRFDKAEVAATRDYFTIKGQADLAKFADGRTTLAKTLGARA